MEESEKAVEEMGRPAGVAVEAQGIDPDLDEGRMPEAGGEVGSEASQGAPAGSGSNAEPALPQLAKVPVQVTRVLEQIASELSADRFREEQIRSLHYELQSYRQGVAEQPLVQLLRAVIHLYDDVGKVELARRVNPPQEVTLQLLLQTYGEFRADLELLLEQHGVVSFQVAGEAFDPRRQMIRRTAPTTEAADVGRIAERLAVGFERGESVLQKERVAVYVGQTTTEEKQPTRPEESEE